MKTGLLKWKTMLAAAIVAVAAGFHAQQAFSRGATIDEISPQEEMTNENGVLIQPIDPIITGNTQTSKLADPTWENRHGKRKRCNFCVGYQPFPGE